MSQRFPPAMLLKHSLLPILEFPGFFFVCPNTCFDVLVYSGEVSALLTLSQYLREHLGLTGTKVTCAQAG